MLFRSYDQGTGASKANTTTGASGEDDGGGVFAGEGTVVRMTGRARLEGNRTMGNGGGIYIDNGSLSLIGGVSVVENSAGGVGGGVATFALQFAVAAGAEVWVTSSSADKIARAVSLGAKGGFDYTAADWPAQATARAGAFDVIVDSVDRFKRLIDFRPAS